MELTLFISKVTGDEKNCSYPYKVVVNNPDELKDAVRFDHVCAEYRNGYRRNSNFVVSDCAVMDCDNDASDDPEDWITPEALIEELDDVPFAVTFSRHHMKSKNGKKRYVWRCRKRASKGVDNCQSRTLHEEVLQDAVVQAIKQTICSPEAEYTAIETKVLEELSTGHEAELINIEEQLKELQDKVVKSVNNNDEFDSLVDKIEQLRNRKEELTREQAQDHRNAECITELKEAIEAGKGEALAYSDKLVRDFIEKIEVFPNTLRVTLKAGVSTMVKM